MAQVKFVTCSAAQFATAAKDEGTLYFVSDERRIYRGAVPFSGGIYKAVTAFPSAAEAERNVLYTNTATGEVKYFDGSAFVTVVLPKSTVISVSSTNAQLATAKAVADYVATEIAKVNETGSGLNSRLKAVETKASTNATNIKANADAITALTNGQVKTNATDIEGLQTRMTTAEGNIANNATAAAGALAEAQKKVASVTAGTGITVGGTATAPTVSAKVSTATGNILKADANGLFVPTPAAAPEYSIVKDAAPGEYAAVYHLTKGGTNTGVAINIPKDMVVSSGEVVKDPEGKDAGTYLVLTLANATNDKVYIPVTSLIDIYTSGSATADKVQISVADNKIAATVKAGSIELADLTTTVQAKINAAVPNTRTIAGKALSANITAADMRTALNVADGAEVNQNAFSNVKVGATTIAASAKTDAVEVAAGSNITVTPDAANKKITIAATGLETAGTAQGLINALDVTDAAAAGKYVSAVSQENGKIAVTRASLPTYTLVEGTTNGTVSFNGTPVKVHGLGSAAFTAATDYDKYGDAAAALKNAKAYTDTALTWGTL